MKVKIFKTGINSYGNQGDPLNILEGDINQFIQEKRIISITQSCGENVFIITLLYE